MRTHFHTLIIISLLIFSYSCTVPEEREVQVLNVDYYNPAHQKIWEFKDQNLTDSLFIYLRNEDPSLRYLAALAFSSISAEKSATDSLAYLLKDPVAEVRSAAAFSMGQLKNSLAEVYLTDAFERHDSLGQWRQSNKMILESTGKCGSKKSLQAISTITTYSKSDSMLLCGQIQGIYNFGLRNMYSSESINTAIRILKSSDNPETARETAAHYLARAPKEWLDYEELRGIRMNTLNDNMKMSFVRALAKCGNPESLEAVLSVFNNREDYRVKLNGIQSLGANYPYDSIHTVLVSGLSDANKHIQNAAADQLILHGDERYAKSYFNMAKDTFPLIIKSKLLTAANKHIPKYFVDTRTSINRQLMQFVEGEFSPQSKLQAIEGLSFDRWNYRYIFQKTSHHPSPAMRTAGIMAIKNICKEKGFRKYYGGSYRKVRKEIADSLKNILLSGDDGPIYEGASILNISDIGFKRVYPSTAFLDSALNKLVLPRQVEAFDMLKKQINIFRGQPEEIAQAPKYNHPIQWSQLDEIKNDEKIVIRTSKGDIVLQMLPELAPATVANFIELIKADYYKNNQFHRVVSNFVIQGGCPRGDGYGSLNHSIRSEFSSSQYLEGMVGMASAGPNTECSQFFITHSQTPHLDGRYTIFARVSEGMDIVHQIQQGDQIIDIEFLN